jgi:GntR family transcriptional regulator, vanillate catabolism transcriptional regulator
MKLVPHVPRSGADATSQTERVVLALREMLLRGDFRPGERLAELTLVPRLKASRTPVRLALDRLAHEGLIEALPAGGFKVREFALADIWDAIEIRGVLEGTAARLAAERLTGPDELTVLRKSCREIEHAMPLNPERFGRYLLASEAYHAELWRLAKSPMLLRAIESVVALPFAAPGALVFNESELVEGSSAAAMMLEHHRSLAEAIENREGTRAESLAREHARIARRNLSRTLQDRKLFNQVPGASLIVLPGPILNAL